jgi:enoyl-CoA hydratase/carnithine racemase
MAGHKALDRAGMRKALAALDKEIQAPTRLVIGGGAAMVLAYDHPLATHDVDAFTARGGLGIAELDAAAKRVARALDIEPDWLNSHFETYTGVLPEGYSTRLRRVYDGTQLSADALGPEDLLVMKCFAGRDKDRSHARKLIRLVADFDVIDAHLARLVERGYPGAQKAVDYLDDLRDEADL